MKIIKNKKPVLSIGDINEMLSTSMDNNLQSTVLFKVLSDKNLVKHGVITIGDGDAKTQLEIEPEMKIQFEKEGRKMFFPGTLMSAKCFKIIRNKLTLVKNTHLEVLRDSQLEKYNVDANKFSKIVVDPARRDLKVRDLLKMKTTTGISEELWLKICQVVTYKTSFGHDSITIKAADESGRITFKIWKTHPTLLKSIQEGDTIRFRNLQLKVQERDGATTERWLQYLPKYTLHEKIEPEEVATLPNIPERYELGDEVFKGQVIAFEGFTWIFYCHLCPYSNKVSNCKVHQHGRDVDITTYMLKMVCFDDKEKKEFYVHKKEIEEFRDSSLTLEMDEENEDQDLDNQFEELMDKPVTIIYNVSAKTGDFWIQKISIIDTIEAGGDKQAKGKKKAKKRALDQQQQEEEQEEKKTKYDDEKKAKKRALDQQQEEEQEEKKTKYDEE